MDINERHEKMIYPSCRVRTDKAGGSGTVVFCEKDQKEEGEFITIVLTNAHVIDGAISYKKDWDSVIKQKIDREFLSKVEVEIFDYVNTSTVNSSNTFKADIVAYDKEHDLALLKLDSPKKVNNVAKLIPKEDIKKKMKLCTPVVVVGCSLLHDPIPNEGQITSIGEIIDNKKYCMTNANIIFGNSGGSVYIETTGEFIGVPSRVQTLQLGFGLDVVTWMGFFAHPERVYEFFDQQLFQFLYDVGADNFHVTMEKREKRQHKALYRIKSTDVDEDMKSKEADE